MDRAVFSAAIACALAGPIGAASADELLRLWGFDSDDSQLFAIDDVRNPAGTMVDYGPVYMPSPEGFGHEVIGGGVRAFTIVNTYDAFLVVNRDAGGHAGPVLLHIDLHDIGTTGGLVTAEVVGSLADAGWDGDWHVTGIAGDPLYGEMYVLGADGDETTDDRLAVVRAHNHRTLEVEPIGAIRWDRGRVTMGADITLGPAGLLMVSDEASGRIVMVEPDTGAVAGVRIEGVRVDTDTARYSGLAWDGYNERTAMYDSGTGQLVIDNRSDNSISSFNLARAGVTSAEGLAFVFRPSPPDQGVQTRGGLGGGGVANIAQRSYGSSRGVSPTPGSGGGGSGRLSLLDLLAQNGSDQTDLPDDEYSSDPPQEDGPTTGDPADTPSDPDGENVPAPGAAALLGLGAAAMARRRRR